MALAETFQPQYSQQSKGASEGEEKNICLLKLAKQKYNGRDKILDRNRGYLGLEGDKTSSPSVISCSGKS